MNYMKLQNSLPRDMQNSQSVVSSKKSLVLEYFTTILNILCFYLLYLCCDFVVSVHKLWCSWSECESSGVAGLCVEALVWLVCVWKLWCGWSECGSSGVAGLCVAGLSAEALVWLV